MPPAAGSRAAPGVSTSDRRQSTRQGRSSVTRPTNYYARSFASRMAAMGGMEQTPPASNSPGFLPALTHFTQAVDAFPKELIKHFSMFKEVEAKIHDPEHLLKLLLDDIARQPMPTAAQRHHTRANTEANNSVAGSVNGSVAMDATTRHQQLSVELFPADFASLPAEEQADLKKRQLFFRLRMLLAAMLPTLDEKLVVLTSAKATKDKGLARMSDSYAHLDDEISEEARYGSLNHWAYADKEEKKKGGTHERHRREVVTANNLAAAAQLMHDADSIAAKSEARREAMLANKRNRHQQVDSDFDDRPAKKTHKRKVIAADADERHVGLGISNGVAPAGKRKKTEKALAAAAPAMERSLSGALQAAGAGGRSGISPRATPGVEPAAKRKPRAAPGPTQGRKRAAIPSYSPPLASSPLAPTFTNVKTTTAAERPMSARARKNSIANSITSAAQEPTIPRRPSSTHSVRPVNSSNAIIELEQASGINRDNLSAKGASTPKEPIEVPASFESSNLKHEETEAQEPERMEIDIPAPAPVTTRAGRTSKTATPIVGTFPDIPMARSRSTRNAKDNSNGPNSGPSSENNSTTTGAVSKRVNHKKTAQTTAAASAHSPALKAANKSGPPSSSASSVAADPEFSDGAEVDEDGDEPRYCYCNEVSYGNMIACDNDSCPREWFHLQCVSLDKAPNARTKWFCSDDCERAFKKGNKAKGGRPGSSRQ
ncbi:hypothetical protein EJ04DRAFT_513209 [Polyplosphaeria fusca]|uniref:Inhibitor of growth protein n=1 Tax=Polyplosphaeria fusca TaxID=682080 RepID=A0A9P4QVW8_9PLEO|nr:hypothetical protein EJ04DRAFT_513209 [Polyplosphaeria fusca]